MSDATLPKPRANREKLRFVIVASQFNENFVQGLIDHATDEFRTHAPLAELTTVRVPGAFEIPIVAREIAREQKPNAILAVGVILKGQTDHAEHLARSVTDALQRIALENGTPVINCVLSLANETQARERCRENKINRGTEAAQAALQVTDVLRELRGK